MFDTIIVPLDGSPPAEAAIPAAVNEARRHGASVVLIHVIARPEPCRAAGCTAGVPTRQVERPYDDLNTARQDAMAYLEDVARRFSLDRATSLCVDVGVPARRVTAEAQRYRRPLVVMLTRDCTRGSCPPLSLDPSSLLIAGAVPVLGIHQPPPAGGAKRSAPAQSTASSLLPAPAYSPRNG